MFGFTTVEEEDTHSGQVSYSVEELCECSYPECESRRNYGVKVTKLKPNMVLDRIRLGRKKQVKTFCPKHRPSVPESKKALNKEHQKALDKWKREKDRRSTLKYNDITGSDILPTFRYSRGTLEYENNRFSASGFEQFEDAMNYLSRCKIDVPILIHDHHSRYAIVEPESPDARFYDVREHSGISYKQFNEEFSDVEYVDRQFYAIKTNRLTGIGSDVTVNEVEEHVDRVIEWREYNETQGYIDVSMGCHLCSLTYGAFYYSRVIRDGKEVIIVEHNGCENIIGEINPKMIDEKSYDIINQD